MLGLVRSEGIGEVSLKRLVALCLFTVVFFLLQVLAGKGSHLAHDDFNYKSYFGQNDTITACKPLVG